MKHRLLATLMSCACLVTATAAYAQGHGPHDHHGGPHHGGPGPHRGPPDDRYDRFDQRVNDRHGYAPHRWNRGDRIPVNYRSRQYVVEDYRRYHLAPPPRGHQWVAVGADYFLVGIATGLIAQAVFGN